MAAKLYTIVYRDLMKQKVLKHETYSKELHERQLVSLKKNRCCEIIEVKGDRRRDCLR